MLELDELQQRYCEATDRERRRSAGQFFTPRWIAQGMASWVVACEPAAIIDPALGFGILLDECHLQGYQGKLLGYEIDDALVKQLRLMVDSSFPVEVHAGDFLALAPSQFSAVIANPPYNRFQNRDLPMALQRELASLIGGAASGYTNQYALFMYVAIARLAESGRAAFIVPSEFLATGYGLQVKRFLLETKRLRHLVLFDTASRIFPDAATTACVLLFDRGLQDHVTVRHLRGEEDADVFLRVCREVGAEEHRTDISYANLDPADNWQVLGGTEVDWAGFVELGAFGRVKRGIATGANEYFVMRGSEAQRWGLESGNLLPCIHGANSAADAILTEADWERWRDSDKPAYLFDGVRHPSPQATVYVRHGEQMEFDKRYLTKMRRPWYRLERRDVAPLLLACFGRDGFRAVLNRSSAVNLTAFHGFYPLNGRDSLVDLLWMYFQTATARLAFAAQHRSYGDGLKKLEPGDWLKLRVPDWPTWPQDALDAAAALARQGALARSGGNVAAWDEVVTGFDHLVRSVPRAQTRPSTRRDISVQLRLA